MSLNRVKGSVWNSVDNGLGVNVKDFGAVGDGVADDTAAIQAAIDSITDTGAIITDKERLKSNKVVLPAGIYKTTAVIELTDGIWLDGAGPNVSVIRPTHTGIGISMGNMSDEHANIRVSNLAIEGNTSDAIVYGAWTTTTTVGIDVARCIRSCFITNCLVTKCDISVNVYDSWTLTIEHSQFLYATQYHVKWKDATNALIDNNRFDWAELSCIWIDGTDAGTATLGVVITNNAIQICWQNGVRVYDTHSAFIKGNFFESNYREASSDAIHTYADVNIETGSNARGRAFTVNENYFTPGSSPSFDAYTAIRANRAESLTVIGNTCSDSRYWKFVDANNTNVSQMYVLGNSMTGTFTNIGIPVGTTGIMADPDKSGDVLVKQLKTTSIKYSVQTFATSVTSDDETVAFLLNTTTGNKTLNLRDADCVAGRMIILKKTDGSGNQVAAQREGGSSKTINGAASVTSTAAYATFTFISDGSNWFTI